jgi:hypothetical protein
MKSSAKDQAENTGEKIAGKVHEKIVQTYRVLWTRAADHALECSSDLGCCCKMHHVRHTERYDVFGIKEFKSNCNNNLNLRREIDQSAAFWDGRGVNWNLAP